MQSCTTNASSQFVAIDCFRTLDSTDSKLPQKVHYPKNATQRPLKDNRGPANSAISS
jgi:hypothetical protein